MTRWMRLLVALYPRSWRERYAAELEALIEDTGPGWRAALDVARGAASMQFAHGLGAVRHHTRRLAATPAFTLTAIGTLAVAFGAVGLVAALVRGIVLAPLPYDEPERLIGVAHRAPGFAPGPIPQAPFTYFTYREAATTLEDIGLWDGVRATITGRGEPEEVPALVVTDGTLPLLRIRPAEGRLFGAEDDSPHGRESVLLGWDYWVRTFGGKAAAGQSLVVDGRAREILGVLPAGFELLGHRPDLVLPLRLDRARVQVGLFRYRGLARLAPGVTRAQAHADLAWLVPSMPDRFPIPTGFTRAMYDEFGLTPDVHPLHEDLVGEVSGTLWLVFGAVALLLLVGCANVATLFLVRGDAQRQDVAVQLALGAGIRRLAGQRFGEALVVALAGAVLGLTLADWGLGVLRQLDVAALPRLRDVRIDAVIAAVVALLAVAAAGGFALLSLMRQGQQDLVVALRGSGRGASDGRERLWLRHALVSVQLAVALVLLVGAGLLVRTTLAIRDVRPGFSEPARVLTVRLTIPEGLVADPLVVARTHAAIADRFTGVAGVSAAGLTSSVTMDGANRRDPLFAEGTGMSETQWPPVRRQKWVAPGYFGAVGNPVLAGRDLSWEDVHQRRPVALLTQNLATALFGGAQAAVGRRVRPSSNGPWREVVGVVGDEHDDGPARPATPTVYWPFLQDGFAPGRTTVERTMVHVLRTTRGHDTSLLQDLQQAVWAVHPSVPLARVESLLDVYERSTRSLTFVLVVLGLAAGATLVLGVVGVYGVVAYVVSQQRREIGIRIALGSSAAAVERLFVRRGMAVVSAGLVVGLVASAAAARVLEALLFEVTMLDPLAYGAAAMLLGVVAGVAVGLPARAAARVPAATVLRG
jgi:predicted permease